MKRALDSNPVTTYLVLIVAIVGGFIAFFHPADIEVFLKYSGGVGAAALGLGVLGVARSQAGKG